MISETRAYVMDRMCLLAKFRLSGCEDFISSTIDRTQSEFLRPNCQ